MIISEKQITKLTEIARRYTIVCEQMDWVDHMVEVRDLLHTICDQQSDELRQINNEGN